MAIIKHNRHEHHRVVIEQPPIIRRGPKKGQVSKTHLAALRCVRCDQHLQWLSREDLALLRKSA